MELDVRVNDKSIAIEIADPFRLDLAAMSGRIEGLFRDQGLSTEGLDIEGLLPVMVRGVAGCEAGCPADAKGIVERGFGDYRLAYVEGGILTAQADVGGAGTLVLKLFPDF